MNLMNKQYQHGNRNFASTATIGKTAGKHIYVSQNLLTIPQGPLLINSPHTEVFKALTNVPFTLTTTTSSLLLSQKNALTE